MAKIFYVLVILNFMTFGSAAVAGELPANPWNTSNSASISEDQPKQKIQNTSQVSTETFGPVYPQKEPTVSQPSSSYANPWTNPHIRQNAATRNNRLEPSHERYVNAAIPNTVNYVPRIQRGGAGVVSRQTDAPAPEPSFWDGWFGEDSAGEAPATGSDSDDMFASLFGDDNPPQPESDSDVMDDLGKQYQDVTKDVTNKYNSAKNTVTRTIDSAKRSVDNLTREAQKFLP